LVDDLGDVVVFAPLILTLLVVFITLFGFLHGCLKGGLHESILTHDHLSVNGSKLLSEKGDLLGRHIISIDEQAVLILESERLEVSPDGFFLETLGGLLYSGHVVYWMQISYC